MATGCPKCGGLGGYQVCTRAGGYWKAFHDWASGKVWNTDLDNLKYGTTPRTVTCLDCGKRVPNPTINTERGKL